MTTLDQTRANRANAKASTGPRTPRGKSRAARNAHRHGLSVSVLADPLLSSNVEKLAHIFAGKGASSPVLEPARRAAEAHIDLMRIRKAKHDFIVQRREDPNYWPKSSTKATKQRLALLERAELLPDPAMRSIIQTYLTNQPNGVEKTAAIISELSVHYAALDRYERRALSRRKFAIRELDAALKHASH